MGKKEKYIHIVNLNICGYILFKYCILCQYYHHNQTELKEYFYINKKYNTCDIYCDKVVQSRQGLHSQGIRSKPSVASCLLF